MLDVILLIFINCNRIFGFGYRLYGRIQCRVLQLRLAIDFCNNSPNSKCIKCVCWSHIHSVSICLTYLMLNSALKLILFALQPEAHKQKVQLVSENGLHALMIIHIVLKSLEWLIWNLPLCFEAFNDVIMSSPHFKNLFGHNIKLIHCTCFFDISPLDFNTFDSFFNCSIDFKNIVTYLVPWDYNNAQACTTPITKIKTLRVNTSDINISLQRFLQASNGIICM